MMSNLYHKVDSFYGRLHGSWYGYAAVLASVSSVGVSILLYMQIDPTFSFLTHYLSTIGAAPSWPGYVYTLGMTITNVLKVFFALYIVRFFQLLGAGKRITWTVFMISVISSVGWAISTFVPYTLSLMLHISSALIYFFGSVIGQLLIIQIELKTPRIPNYLAIFGLIVVMTYAAFFVLEIMVLAAPTINKVLSVVTEWLSYLSIMAWVSIHSFYTRKSE